MLTEPYLSQGAEEDIVIKVFPVRGDAQHDPHAAHIRTRLAGHDVTVEILPLPGMHVVVVIGQLLVKRKECIIVVLRPPAGQVAILVVLGAGGVERVGNFMPDHPAHLTVQLLVAHVSAIQYTPAISAHNINGIALLVVEAVDSIRCSSPFVLIYRLAVFLYFLADFICVDASQRLPERSAIILGCEVQLAAFVFAPIVREEDVLL